VIRNAGKRSETERKATARRLARRVGGSGLLLSLLVPSIVVFPVVALAADEAEITSEKHPRLRRVLFDQPDADANADDVLTFTEYRDFFGPPLDVKARRKKRHGKDGKFVPELTRHGDLIVTDFETKNVGQLRQIGWKLSGKAFDQGPARATKVMRRRVGAYSGRSFVSSLVESDAEVGEMTSPRFEIELPYVEFYVSGGKYPEQVCVNLLVDDQVLRTITGLNDDLFQKVAFDVAGLEGRDARIQILDRETELWGHINVDRVVQTLSTDAVRIVDRRPLDFGSVAGVVETRSNRFHGPVDLVDGLLRAGGHDVLFGALVSVVCERRAEAPANTCSLRLVGGETWYGQITSFEEGKIRLRSQLFGERELPPDGVSVVDFLPGETRPSENAPGTLYRTNGGPIPGELVWVRDKDIAIDCALGVLPIPRNLVKRYVFPVQKPTVDVNTIDEIALADGSLLRGKVAFEGQKVQLAHASLGNLSFEWKTVRHLRRALPGVTWLDAISPEVAESVGPFAKPPAPRVEAADSEALRVLRMMPRTVTKFHVPEGSDRVFRARLASVAGSNADVRVRVRAAETVVFDELVSPTEEAIAVEARIPESGATDLSIEVDFDGRLAFPCGVEWLDGFVAAAVKEAAR